MTCTSSICVLTFLFLFLFLCLEDLENRLTQHLDFFSFFDTMDGSGEGGGVEDGLLPKVLNVMSISTNSLS